MTTYGRGERRVVEAAARQDNVISLEQLRVAGFGWGMLKHRLREGTMQRLYRAVYLVGPAPPTLAARARGAVLACGQAAVVSHSTAAALWGMLPDVGEVHVTVTAHRAASRAGITVHRSRSIAATELRGIPISTPARTVCDLAATEPDDVLERALNEARALRLVTERELHAAIERQATRKGTRKLRRLLADAPGITRSEAERLLRTLLNQAQLPQPQTSVKLHGYTVDFLWPAERLIVEVDGFQFHGHRRAFEQDRKRDQVLTARGYRVIRVTWRQLKHEPMATLARIAQALAIAA